MQRMEIHRGGRGFFGGGKTAESRMISLENAAEDGGWSN